MREEAGLHDEYKRVGAFIGIYRKANRMGVFSFK